MNRNTVDSLGAPPRRQINSLDLTLEHRPTQTTLIYQGEALLTADGAPIRDEVPQVIEVILDDLQTFPRLLLLGLQLELPSTLTCYEIHVYRRQDRDRSETEIPNWTAEDPIMNGVFQESQDTDETRIVLDFLRSSGYPASAPTSESRADWASGIWETLDAAQRAVVKALILRHSSAFTLAIGFALGGVDAKGYASAVWRVRERTDDSFRTHDAAQQFEYFERIRRDAWKAERYLTAGMDQLEVLVAKGESADLEFKTTLRKNLRTEKLDRAILGASLKSIAGFLNTEGGTLAVGITDEGEPVANLLALDELRTEDKYLSSPWNKVAGGLTAVEGARI